MLCTNTPHYVVRLYDTLLYFVHINISYIERYNLSPQVIVKKLYSRDLRARRRNWRLKRLGEDLSERTSLRSASDNPYAYTVLVIGYLTAHF